MESGSCCFEVLCTFQIFSIRAILCHSWQKRSCLYCNTILITIAFQNSALRPNQIPRDAVVCKAFSEKLQRYRQRSSRTLRRWVSSESSWLLYIIFIVHGIPRHSTSPQNIMLLILYDFVTWDAMHPKCMRLQDTDRPVISCCKGWERHYSSRSVSAFCRPAFSPWCTDMERHYSVMACLYVKGSGYAMSEALKNSDTGSNFNDI
jgi:hypothetical protein